MNIGTCNVPGDVCPWDNCDTCRVGKEWLMELDRIIALKKENFEREERQYKLYLREFGEKDERTVKSFLRMSALHRDIPDNLKDGRQCPGCRRILGINTNFCSVCGKAILY